MVRRLIISIAAISVTSWLAANAITYQDSEIADISTDETSISSTEADQVIRISESAKREAAAELKTSLESVPAISKREVNNGERKIIIRKVAPPTVFPKIELPEFSTTKASEVNLSDLQDFQIKESVSLQLHATVFDQVYSRLKLRVENQQYVVWTNINMAYMRNIAHFDTENRSYYYFGTAKAIDQERENEVHEIALSKGLEYASRWEAPPVRFEIEPEYVLVTENDQPVPDEVYQQLDDVLVYYLSNKEALKVQYDNSVKMQAARERYKAAHPEEPQDIVINFSRMSTPAE